MDTYKYILPVIVALHALLLGLAWPVLSDISPGNDVFLSRGGAPGPQKKVPIKGWLDNAQR